MAHLPRLLVLLFFLGVHVPASHGTPLPSTYDGSICSESFRCGDIEISYPFYLSNATGETDYNSYSCGYTDLRIFCLGEGPTGGTPTIRLRGDNYTVKNISYKDQTIVLADSDVLGGGKCPTVRHNVTLEGLWLQLHNTISYGNLTFFFGCYPGDLAPPVFGMYRINCQGFSDPPGGGVSYVFSSDGDDASLEHELEMDGNCAKVVAVPVLRHSLEGSNQSTLPREYGAVLEQGFELAWNHATADSCYACEAEGSHGRCAYTQKRAFFGCLCSDGKVGAQDCRNSSASSRASKKNRIDGQIRELRTVNKNPHT